MLCIKRIGKRITVYIRQNYIRQQILQAVVHSFVSSPPPFFFFLHACFLRAFDDAALRLCVLLFCSRENNLKDPSYSSVI